MCVPWRLTSRVERRLCGPDGCSGRASNGHGMHPAVVSTVVRARGARGRPRIENFSRDWGVTVTASGACHLVSAASAIRKYQWWHMLAGHTPHWHAFCVETRRVQAIGGDNAIDQTGVGDQAGTTDEPHFLEYTLV